MGGRFSYNPNVQSMQSVCGDMQEELTASFLEEIFRKAVVEDTGSVHEASHNDTEQQVEPPDLSSHNVHRRKRQGTKASLDHPNQSGAAILAPAPRGTHKRKVEPTKNEQRQKLKTNCAKDPPVKVVAPAFLCAKGDKGTVNIKEREYIAQCVRNHQRLAGNSGLEILWNQLAVELGYSVFELQRIAAPVIDNRQHRLYSKFAHNVLN